MFLLVIFLSWLSRCLTAGFMMILYHTIFVWSADTTASIKQNFLSDFPNPSGVGTNLT